MARTAGVALLCLLLAGCGSAQEPSAAPSSSASSSSASSASTSPSPRPTPTPTPTPTLSPEQEAQVVAMVTGNVFAQNEEALSTQLIKSSSLVEAQEDFRFDQPSRTLIVTVSSVISTEPSLTTVAYDLATGFAPVFWGPQALASARPESLVFFSVTVNGSQHRCDGPTMAALADKELSKEMFAQRCAA
jgi:hypothetical protein